MTALLFLPIYVPFAAGILALALPAKFFRLRQWLAVFAAAVTFAAAAFLFKKEAACTFPLAGGMLDFSLRLYSFSGFILLAASAFGLLIAVYALNFLRDKGYQRQFYAYFLLALSFVNGAVLADNLLLLLFFWEGLLALLFGMIAVGGRGAFRSATKMLVIVGVSDLCLMVGIALAAGISGTLAISRMHLGVQGAGALAFMLLAVGAAAKAGCMPFHSWIPDAAEEAPLPFMAFMPAALEKLLGIYFLSRVCLDIFALPGHSWAGSVLMIAGAVTIILAVMMALIQKDFKRLLSYHAISQVGYMVLGIGTGLPAGIVGGLFHMLNNAMYKSCLFLSAGAVEKQAGSTDLRQLGGLGLKMPVTFGCFIISALSISGVPPFNGFFSKELIYDAALERGWIFYLAASLGSFFTAASFLKLGHAAFLGRLDEKNRQVKEAGGFLLAPMLVIAFGCILFGLYNNLPLAQLIQPAVGQERLGGHTFSGMPANFILVVITVVVLIAAFLNHLLGVKLSGSGLGAAEHIHHAPVLSVIYGRAEKRFFDPYEWGMNISGAFANIAWALDRATDYLYQGFAVNLCGGLSSRIRKLHTGNLSLYLAWSLLGIAAVVIFLLRV